MEYQETLDIIEMYNDYSIIRDGLSLYGPVHSDIRRDSMAVYALFIVENGGVLDINIDNTLNDLDWTPMVADTAYKHFDTFDAVISLHQVWPDPITIK